MRAASDIAPAKPKRASEIGSNVVVGGQPQAFEAPAATRSKPFVDEEDIFWRVLANGLAGSR